MRGQYKTVQRKAIIDCLSHARGHMTAAAVCAALSESGHKVSSATVYRQLEKLVDEGDNRSRRVRSFTLLPYEVPFLREAHPPRLRRGREAVRAYA